MMDSSTSRKDSVMLCTPRIANCAGMSLGYADNSMPENRMALHKLEVEEFTTFVDA